MYEPARKKFGTDVLWSGLYWSIPGASLYSDCAILTTLLHSGSPSSRADGKRSTTCSCTRLAISSLLRDMYGSAGVSTHCSSEPDPSL